MESMGRCPVNSLLKSMDNSQRHRKAKVGKSLPGAGKSFLVQSKSFPRGADFAAPALEQLLAQPASPSFLSGRARKIHGPVPQIGEQIRGKSGCEFLFWEGVNARLLCLLRNLSFTRQSCILGEHIFWKLVQKLLFCEGGAENVKNTCSESAGRGRREGGRN